ncbi:hypothetical protein ABB02_01322 [Clostridiaceae bacterium JG1575]|nr:hypothetical protein ABB02_01322 [Clostridiaceae bacterium JG1575]
MIKKTTGNPWMDAKGRQVMYGFLLLFILGYGALDYYTGQTFALVLFPVYPLYLLANPLARRRLYDYFKQWRAHWTGWALLLIALWSLFSAIWSQAREDTLSTALLYFYMLMVYLGMAVEFPGKRWRKGFMIAFTLVIVFTMGYLALEYGVAIVKREALTRGRFISTIENTNNLGVVSIMFLMFCASLIRKAPSKKTSLFFAGLSALCALGVLSSQSRSSIIVTGILFVFIIWKYNMKYIWTLALFVVILLFVPSLQQRVLEIFSYEQNVQRVKVWRVALSLFAAHPLLGVGSNAFRVGYVETFKANPQMFNAWDIKVLWHAHNMLMRFSSELGLPGLATLIALMAGSVRMMRGITKSSAYLAGKTRLYDGIYLGILAFYLGNILDSFWASPKPLLVFAVLLGFAASYAQEHGLAS